MAALFGATLMSHAARAAEITVVSSTAMTEFLEAAIPVFERETGNKVKTTFLSSAVLPGKVKEGVQADVIVTTPGIFDDLVKVGKLVPGSRSDFIKSSAGSRVARSPAGHQHARSSRRRCSPRNGLHQQGAERHLHAEPARPARHRRCDRFKRVVFTEPGQRVGLIIASARRRSGQQITELLAMPGIDLSARCRRRYRPRSSMRPRAR